MNITVNGKILELAGPVSLAVFLKERGFAEGKVIIEYNGEILAAQGWKNVVLSPEDRMEIVTFVGGG